MIMWTHDNEANNLPWVVPVAKGGTHTGGPRPGNCYEEWASFANQLTSPKTLKCPSDKRTIAAESFTTKPVGGFYNPKYQNNAVSYFIGLDAGRSGGAQNTFDKSQTHVLAGDTNLKVAIPGEGCGSSGVNNAAGLDPRAGTPVLAWTNALHGLSGNLALADGSVHAIAKSQLIKIMKKADDPNSPRVHALMPK